MPRFSIGMALFAAVFPALAWSVPAAASPPDVVVSEVMFNPDGDENAREYVEMYNRSGTAVSLEGFRIGDGTAFDLVTTVPGGGWIVPPYGYAVVFDPDYFTAGAPYGTIPAGAVLFTVADEAIGSRGLSNSSPETVAVVSAAGDTLSAVRYDISCPAGYSWERVIPGGGDGPDNFRPSRAKDGTPGARNSATPPDENPSLGEGSIRFDPSVPVMGKPMDIVVSFKNGGLAAVTGARVALSLKPGKSLGEVIFEGAVEPGAWSETKRIAIPRMPGGRSVVEAVLIGDMDPAGAADDTARAAVDVPVAPGTVILNEIMAAPSHGPEWVEIYNIADAPVSLLGWSIHDGGGKDSNAFGPALVEAGGYAVIAGGEPDFSVPQDVVVVRAGRFPSLNNDGDAVVLAGFDSAAQDSAAYKDAFSGVSLELVSPDLRGGSGAWDRCVDPAGSTPGRANSILFDGGGSGTAKGVALKVTPNPFDERTVVSFELPFPLARVRLDVYDRRGRKVATLRDGTDSGSKWETSWDGRSGGRRLPAGAYILFLEALDRSSGATVTLRTPVVIARKL